MFFLKVVNVKFNTNPKNAAKLNLRWMNHFTNAKRNSIQAQFDTQATETNGEVEIGKYTFRYKNVNGTVFCTAFT